MGKKIRLPAHINDLDFRDNIVFPSNVNDKVLGVDEIGGYIELTNLKFSELKTILNNPDYSLGDMAINGNINKFSRFRSDKLTPHSIGEFAGYTHANAMPCAYYELHENTSKFWSTIYNKYYYNVYVYIWQGEREPLYCNDANAWNTIVVRLTIDGVMRYSTISIGDQAYFEIQTTNGSAENKSATVDAFYIYSVDQYTKDADNNDSILLTGYGAGDVYGLRIEDNNAQAKTFTLNVSSAPVVSLDISFAAIYDPATRKIIITITENETGTITTNWDVFAWDGYGGITSQSNTVLQKTIYIDDGTDINVFGNVTVNCSGKPSETWYIDVYIYDELMDTLLTQKM